MDVLIKSYLKKTIKDKILFIAFIIGLTQWFLLIISGLLIGTKPFEVTSAICFLFDFIIIFYAMLSLLIKIAFYRKETLLEKCRPFLLLFLFYVSILFPGKLIYRTLNFANFYIENKRYVQIINFAQSDKIIYDELHNRIANIDLPVRLEKDSEGRIQEINIGTCGDLPFFRGGFLYFPIEKQNLISDWSKVYKIKKIKPHWYYYSE
jgi:hypothetical protein